MDKIILKRIKDKLCDICSLSDHSDNSLDKVKLYELKINHNDVILCNKCIEVLASTISNQSIKTADDEFLYITGENIKIIDLKNEEPGIYKFFCDVFENDNTLINSNYKRNIHEVFRCLTSKELKVMMLYYKNNLNYGEISQSLSIDPIKAREILYKGLYRIKEGKRYKNILLNGIKENEITENQTCRMTIEEFNEEYAHSVYLLNALRRNGFFTVSEIIEKKENELRRIRGIGAKNIETLKKALLKANLKLRE